MGSNTLTISSAVIASVLVPSHVLYVPIYIYTLYIVPVSWPRVIGASIQAEGRVCGGVRAESPTSPTVTAVASILSGSRSTGPLVLCWRR